MPLLVSVRRVGGPALFGLILSIFLALVRPVAAQLPAQLRLRWEGASSCPRNAEFDRELARLLGERAREVEPSEVTLQVRARERTEGPPTYHLLLVLEVAQGQSERELELASCADLRHAAALLIATALEHAQAPATDDPVEAIEASPPPPQAVQLRVGALFDVGSLPGPTGGPTAGVGYERGGFRLVADARYLLARERGDTMSRLVADIDLFAGSLGGAYLWPVGPLQLGPTLDAELGYLRGRGRGEAGAPNDGTFWAGALVGSAAELPLGERLTLALALQASVPLLHAKFRLEGELPFYQTGGLAFRASLGMRVRFGFKNEHARGQ